MASPVLAAPIGLLPESGMTYGLFDALRPLPANGVHEDRWITNGITFEPRPCRGAYRDNTDLCGENVNTTDSPDCETWITQKPFRIYDVLSYQTANVVTEDMEGKMRDRMRDLASALFAQELIDGAGSGGYSLANLATAPADIAFGAGAAKLRRAVAVLENELAADLRGRRGMIHMPPGLFTQAVNSLSFEKIDGRWYTPNGNIVVTDAGYRTGAAPTGQSAAAATADWVYASGEVFYLSSTPDLVGDAMGSFNMGRNTVRRFVEGFGILLFDVCPISAVLTAYEDI